MHTSNFPSYGPLASQEHKGNILLSYDVKKSLKFSYANISYDVFSKSFKPKIGLGERLVWSLASMVGLIAYPIICAICFLFLAFPCSSKGKIYAALYTNLRSFQWVAGTIIRPFHNTYGSFLVESAEFHSTCYRAYTSQSTPPEFRGYRQTPHEIEASQITFSSFRQLTREEQIGLFQELNLDIKPEDLADDKIAELTLPHLLDFKDHSWILHPTNVRGIGLDCVESPLHMQILKRRLDIEYPVVPQPTLEMDAGTCTVGKIYTATGEMLNSYLTNIPPEALWLLRDEQLRELDLTKASVDQLKELCARLYVTEVPDFCNLFTPNQWNHLFPYIPEAFFSKLPVSFLHQIDFSNPDCKMQGQLFFKKIVTSHQQFQIFTSFSAEKLLTIFPLLEGSPLGINFPLDRIKELDFTKISDGTRWKLCSPSYPSTFPIEYCESIARPYIQAITNIEEIILRLSPEELALLSDQQIRALDVASLPLVTVQELFAPLDCCDEKRFFIIYQSPDDFSKHDLSRTDLTNKYFSWLSPDQQKIVRKRLILN